MSVELIEAVSTGNYDSVNKLISGGADVNYKGKHNTTPLIEASKNGNIAVIQLLLQANAHVGETDNNGMNALMHAVFLKNTEAVLLLLDTSIDINARDKDNNSAVINCFIGRYDQIDEEDFIKKATSKYESSLMNISSTKYPFQRSLHYYNTNLVDVDILKALLEKGADVNTIDANKKTILIHATEQENLEAVKIILKYNPNINHIDGHGSNALSYASRFNNTQIAVELINSGIDINLEDELESTPLIYANMLTNTKIQAMINTAKYVDFLLNNSLETFDNSGEIDSRVLTARYEFLLNKIEIDFEDFHLKLQKINSSSLNQKDKNQLKKIFANLLFKNDDYLKDEDEFSIDVKNNLVDIETNDTVSISDFLDPLEPNEDKHIFDQLDEYCESLLNH
ncbi:MAG: ankyrin repeat domain-containing protein [Rickettsiales bacterium]|nr:MAG: ankyrin repeat domain-containing protein [Rickettsiales bacterium]